MSLGGKYVFATVMCLVLPMCILISCSYVLCVLMALAMFMKVMPSLISVIFLCYQTALTRDVSFEIPSFLSLFFAACESCT